MDIKDKKYYHKKDQAEKKQTFFCTECGEELDLFGITNTKIDLEEVKKRYHNCKEKGKFKGDKCAMLFITEPEETSNDDEGDD